MAHYATSQVAVLLQFKHFWCSHDVIVVAQAQLLLMVALELRKCRRHETVRNMDQAKLWYGGDHFDFKTCTRGSTGCKAK